MPSTTNSDIDEAKQTPMKRLFRKTIGPYASVLSTPYRWLWLSAMASEFGNWFSNIANITTLTQVSHGNTSGTAVSIMFVTTYAPPLLLNPIAGVIADTFDKRLIMLISDLVRCLVVLSFLIVQIDIERLYWLLYVLNATMFCCNAFFEPAREGLVPFLVRSDQLIATNSMDSITWSSVTFLGASVGGFAASFFGPKWNYIIDAITFALSSCCVVALFRSTLSVTYSSPPSGDSNSNTPPSKQTDQYAISQPVQYTALLQHPSRDSEKNFTNSDEGVELAGCEILEIDSEPENQTRTHPTEQGESDAPITAAATTTTITTSNQSEESLPNPSSQLNNSISLQFSDSSACGSNDATESLRNSSEALCQEPSVHFAPLSFFRTHVSTYLNGIRFALKHPYTTSFAFIKGSNSLFSGVVDILIVKVAESTFKIGGNAAAVLGISNAIIGASAGLSPVFEERVFPHSPSMIRALVIENFVLLVIGMLLLGTSTSIARNVDESNLVLHVAVFVLFEFGYMIIGVGLGCLWVKSTTALQQLTSEAYLGRMISLDLSIWVLGKVISVLFGGFILDQLHLPIDVLCFIGAAIAVVVFVWWSFWAWKFSHIRVHTRAIE